MKASDLFLNCLQKLSGLDDARELRMVALLLLEDRFGISRIDVMLQSEIEWTQQSELEHCLARLLAREPIQYVTGKAHFYGHTFQVAPGVLIPRPETEELVHWIVSGNKLADPVIWDIGTGSGCIAISLKKAIPGARVYASDISEGALHIAKENADKLNARVEFLLSDIFSDEEILFKPDIIVSNPPYIPERDKKTMHKNVLEFEPHMALFVPDDDALKFYRRIAQVAKLKFEKSASIGQASRSSGKLYFEIHEHYSDEIRDMMNGLGFEVEVRRDLQGKARMVRGVV
jgi:release factor glutamine methyltransferase